MKKILLFLFAVVLSSCAQVPQQLKQFTSPYGGTYALRLPDQIQVTENSFLYEVTITNRENGYSEKQTFKLERMNFHPFTPTFKRYQLQYLHFKYFTYPQKIRAEAYEFLQKWDNKITNNPDLFEVKKQLIFALCKKQPIADNKIVTTIFSRMNKDDEFIKIFDNLAAFKNTSIPTIAYQDFC